MSELQLLFQKVPIGLVPASEEGKDWLSKKKMGSTVLVVPKELRNPGFFRKWFALVQLAFDYWSEAVEPLQYKGIPVEPNFDRFRRDVTIMSGFYVSVVNLRGEVRLEAESISWARMTEERFEKLFSATINTLLKMVFNGRICNKMTEIELRNLADQIVDFG